MPRNPYWELIQAYPNKSWDYNIISQNGLYTKMLHIPQDSSQYTLQIQRKCANPIGGQKPFPYAANNTHSPSIASLSSSTVQTGTNGPPPAIITPFYVKPPHWYTQTNNISQM